jgi:hypothetical protein
MGNNIMRQISGFLQVLRFPPLNKTDRNDISEILLKVALKQTKKNPVTQVILLYFIIFILLWNFYCQIISEIFQEQTKSGQMIILVAQNVV